VILMGETSSLSAFLNAVVSPDSLNLEKKGKATRAFPFLSIPGTTTTLAVVDLCKHFGEIIDGRRCSVLRSACFGGLHTPLVKRLLKFNHVVRHAIRHSYVEHVTAGVLVRYLDILEIVLTDGLA